MTYTEAAVLGVVVALTFDVVTGTRLVTRRAFWVAYAIVLAGQLVVNGLLTGLEIVRYDPGQILGPRVVFAPVEDLLFGFALTLTTLVLWVRLGRTAVNGGRRARRPGRGYRRPSVGRSRR